jgi:ketosteroid isomerase-like protein
MPKITTILLTLAFALFLNLTSVFSAYAVNQSEDIAQINQILDEYVAGWNQHDPNILKNTWNLKYGQTTYVPVESGDIIQGGDKITNYYQQATPYVASVKLSDSIIDIMGDYAQVVGKTEFEIKNPDGSTYSTPLRTNFTFKRQGNNWLTIHYAESATVQ